MNYVKQILFPGEKVLYDGHVHPRVLANGLIYMGAAALISHFTAHTGDHESFLLNFIHNLAENGGFWAWIYRFCYNWQVSSPDVGFEYKLIAAGVGLWGVYHFIRGLFTMRSTELVVTDMRIIAKTGIFNILTLEMDRRRVSEVLIDQSVWGRILNYGHIYIRGFTGVIGGLPVMVNPHLIERFVNVRY